MISPGEARLSPQMSPSSASSEKGLVFLLSSFPAWASPAWWWAQESRSPAPTRPWSSGPTRTTFDRPANELLLYGNDKQLDTVLYWSNLVIRAPLRAMNIGTKKLMGSPLKLKVMRNLANYLQAFWGGTDDSKTLLRVVLKQAGELGWDWKENLDFSDTPLFSWVFLRPRMREVGLGQKVMRKVGGRGSTKIWETFADYQYLCSSCRGSLGLKIIKTVKIFLKILKT